MKWQGSMYTGVGTIIGEERVENKQCYVLSLILDNDFKYTVPVLGGTITVDKDSVVGRFHEGTGLPIRISGSGSYLGYSGSVEVTFTYRFSGGVLYPLVVGKELSATITMKITATSDVLGTVEYPITVNGKFKVAGEESYQVAGRTLTSKKVTVLDEKGALLATVWVIDSIGWFGKVVIEPNQDYIQLTDSSYFSNP